MTANLKFKSPKRENGGLRDKINSELMLVTKFVMSLMFDFDI